MERNTYNGPIKSLEDILYFLEGEGYWWFCSSSYIARYWDTFLLKEWLKLHFSTFNNKKKKKKNTAWNTRSAPPCQDAEYLRVWNIGHRQKHRVMENSEASAGLCWQCLWTSPAFFISILIRSLIETASLTNYLLIQFVIFNDFAFLKWSMS